MTTNYLLRAFIVMNMLTAPSAWAGKPSSGSPLQITYDQKDIGIVYIVEQQTIGGRWADPSNAVVNNTPEACIWSIDDQRRVNFMGYLDPGQTMQFTHCQISDWTNHISRVNAYADVGTNLELTITVDDGLGHVVTIKNPEPTTVSTIFREYRRGLASNFRALVWPHVYSNASTYLEPIPDSGTGQNSKISNIIGGVGRYVKITYSIKNLGTSRANNVRWDVEEVVQYTQDLIDWCPAGKPSGDPNQCVLGDLNKPTICWCKSIRTQ